MKLFTSFSRTYSSGYVITNPIYEQLKELDSFQHANGIYTAHPDYIEESKLGVFSNDAVLTWYNALQDGNYLQSAVQEIEASPTFITSDSLFNNRPCIDFRPAGDTALRYKFPVEVGAVFIVYMTRDNSSYLIYAPRRTVSNNPSESIYYDAFPPGNGGTLWAEQTIGGWYDNNVFEATSRINSNPVPSNVFVVENVARLLSVSNFNTVSLKESISGYGGRISDLGGSETAYPLNQSKSVNGKIAAIVTYREPLTTDQIYDIEQVLKNYYIGYSGTVLTEDVRLKGVIGSSFAYDFGPVTLDEFYDIVSWELVSPLNLGLTFVGSNLAGVPTTLYDDFINIKITNSNGNFTTFNIPTYLCRRDPLLNNLPRLNQVELVLSSGKDAIDGGTYGVITSTSPVSNEILEWDDARRLAAKSLTRKPVDVQAPTVFSPTPNYLLDDVDFNNQSVASFSNDDVLLSHNDINYQAQTFLWVYYQPNYGQRKFLDSFPDIKGTGELWTVPDTTQVHGTTPVTSLNTRVHKVPINTLSYRLPTGTVYFITAKSTTGAITFKGFQGFAGKLAFFCAWTSILTDEELIDFIPFLTNRYYSDFSPFIFSTSPEYRYDSPIAIDLNFKVVDLRNEALTYNIVQNNYSATINSLGILSFSTDEDETLTFSINVTNESNLTSTLAFRAEIILKTDPLYLAIRNRFPDVKAFYIGLNETITYSTLVMANWADYRNTGQYLQSSNVTSSQKYELENKLAANFNVDGSAFFTVNNPSTISGKCFILGYIRKETATDRALLFGQSTTADFLSGNNGNLWDNSGTSTSITNGTTYVNGKLVNNSYDIKPEVLNTIVINTTTALSFETIAKDRSFTDRSVKGWIPFVAILQEAVTAEDAAYIDTSIRDYYDGAKKIVQLPFDNSLIDIGDRFKTAIGALTFDTRFKFGGFSKTLVSDTTLFTVTVPNQSDFAFLNNDFTVSFWIYCNNSLAVDDRIVLYRQSDLIISIQGTSSGTRLFVSRTGFLNNQQVGYTLPDSIFSSDIFHQVQVGRRNGVCYFFFNGQLINTYSNTLEYADYNSPVILGGGTLNSTGSITLLMDDFVVFRRTCLNTTSFTLPLSPY